MKSMNWFLPTVSVLLIVSGTLLAAYNHYLNNKSLKTGQENIKDNTEENIGISKDLKNSQESIGINTDQTLNITKELMDLASGGSNLPNLDVHYVDKQKNIEKYYAVVLLNPSKKTIRNLRIQITDHTLSKNNLKKIISNNKSKKKVFPYQDTGEETYVYYYDALYPSDVIILKKPSIDFNENEINWQITFSTLYGRYTQRIIHKNILGKRTFYNVIRDSNGKLIKAIVHPDFKDKNAKK